MKIGKEYSKILNNAILEKVRKHSFKKLYLKICLVNYYEKFGAIFLENLNNRKIILFSIIKT